MKNSSDDHWDHLREQIIGLGEHSTRKNYYPELQAQLTDLERFRALLDQSNDAILLIQLPVGRITDLNWSACEQLGYRRDELLNLQISDLTPPGTPDPSRLVTADLHPTQTLTTCLLRQDGSKICVEMTIRFTSFGGNDYLVAVARDISERNRILEALTESENRYRRVVQQVSDGLMIVDPENEGIVETNMALQQLLGYTAGELVHLSPVDLVADGSTTLTADPSATVPVEGELIRKDRSRVPVEVRKNPITYPEGKVVFCWMIRDIRGRRELDRIKREALQQIEQNIVQFATLGDHIRNPLAVIVGLADLEEGIYTKQILRQAEEIDRIIDRLDRGWFESEKVRSFIKKYY
ncbi:PAS domain S-box protein [Methanosphaerula palustris]|uniref:Signal transduction histidine kinase, nitrogen specific, NtrB n=1 Tax=Methanosphaerula palustris (strain ATCC BAA-1556 / DSM 19958 / E1-9c) TaxID=521011 RepID=B8GE43_METPE|nr:PAS domain S-box protein [Methanosphaerula palustris]ACL17544.1 signal transduction histidine kinase, nitrogen specific, NtrB [Methanosphaerula palustris E1-9c]